MWYLLSLSSCAEVLTCLIFLRGQAVDGQVCGPVGEGGGEGGGESDCAVLVLIYRAHNSLG